MQRRGWGTKRTGSEQMCCIWPAAASNQSIETFTVKEQSLVPQGQLSQKLN